MNTLKTTTDSSANRFKNLDTSEKPSVKPTEESNDQNPFLKSETKTSRWSNLTMDEEHSPRNSFQKKRSEFGPDKDQYGNYRKPTFRRSTRPRTPPKPKFDLAKASVTDFPALG